MRLIDADKLMEDIIKICKCQPYLEGMQSEIVYIQDVVDEQPTAFDVDKVVAQLETRRKEYEDRTDNLDTPFRYICYYKGIMRGYEYSIDVIKAGGIDENRNI